MKSSQPKGICLVAAENYNSVIPDKVNFERAMPSARDNRRSAVQELPKSPVRTAAKSLSRVASSAAKPDKRRMVRPTASINLVPSTDYKHKRRQENLNLQKNDSGIKFVKKSSALNVVPTTAFNERKGVALRSNMMKKQDASPPRVIKSATTKNTSSLYTRKAIREFMKNTEDVPMPNHDDPQGVFLEILKER